MPYKGVEVAYAAGLFEGEGSCTVQRNYTHRDGSRRPRKTNQIMLTCAMTDREPLERLEATFGGAIHGPYTADHRWKPIYRWSLWKFERVQAAVAAMWSQLSPRRQAQLAALLKEV